MPEHILKSKGGGFMPGKKRVHTLQAPNAFLTNTLVDNTKKGEAGVPEPAAESIRQAKHEVDANEK